MAKLNAVLLNLTAGMLGVVPVPVKDIVCGEPVALSVMLTVAAFAPVETGVKTAEMMQLAPATSDDPQVSEIAKLLACPPPNVIELTASGTLPVLVKVMVFAEDFMPTPSFPKDNEVALIDRDGGGRLIV